MREQPSNQFTHAGQTVVHEDEDEEITNSLASQLPSGVANPVPAPEEGEEHVPPSVLVSAAGEDSAHNTDQGANPLPADNVDNSSATQDNGAVSAESAVEAAAAAVEDVAAATYSAHAIGNLIAAAELDSPIPGREDMSVDGDNSAPATPSAGAVVDSTHATIPLAEALLPHAADDDGAANSFNDNQTTNPDEQMQS
ncbi:hypothetical protein H4R27_001884 [Coemansia aciculifera]|nr:hypothetical protein H4R27_001884 [Coemansia aciculifera]